jgi:hypothetical protein
VYIEVEQTTQWPKEKVQRDKQRSTKHTHKTKDRVTRNPPKKNPDSDHRRTYLNNEAYQHLLRNHAQMILR